VRSEQRLLHDPGNPRCAVRTAVRPTKCAIYNAQTHYQTEPGAQFDGAYLVADVSCSTKYLLSASKFVTGDGVVAEDC
jgi:hypothetical protein